MSLSSFLQSTGRSGKNPSIDKELDAILKTHVRKPSAPAPSNDASKKGDGGPAVKLSRPSTAAHHPLSKGHDKKAPKAHKKKVGNGVASGHGGMRSGKRTFHSETAEGAATELSGHRLAKGKLSTQRYKAQGESARDTPFSAKPQQTPADISVPVIPKGDPLLGEKIKHLSKEERKQVKATDADRRARRVAKKKARMELARQTVRSQKTERERMRKPASARKANSVRQKKTGKGRQRSEKSMAKKNVKK